MNVKTNVELYDAIEKALQADATACQYSTEPFFHSFSLRKLNMTEDQLSEMLWRLNAGEPVFTNVEATLTHRWNDGSESGAEELSHLAHIELWQERVGEESRRLAIDAFYGAYWELVPQG